MPQNLKICVIIIVQLLCVSTVASSVVDAEFGVTYQGETTPDGDLSIYRYNITTGQVARVWIQSAQPSIKTPLLGVVRGRQTVLSAQVPFKVVSDERNGLFLYDRISLIMCPFGNDTHAAGLFLQGNNSVIDDNNEIENDTDENTNVEEIVNVHETDQLLSHIDEQGRLFVELSSAMPSPVEFNMSAQLIEQFDIRLNENRSFTASPVDAVVFRFTMPDNVSSVVVQVHSNDDLCATVAVKNIQRSWSSQFYVVIAVKSCDFDCTQEMRCITSNLVRNGSARLKHLSLKISPAPSIDSYALPLSITFILIMAFYVLAFALVQVIETRQYQTVQSSICGYAPIGDGPDDDTFTTPTNTGTGPSTPSSRPETASLSASLVPQYGSLQTSTRSTEPEVAGPDQNQDPADQISPDPEDPHGDVIVRNPNMSEDPELSRRTPQDRIIDQRIDSCVVTDDYDLLPDAARDKDVRRSKIILSVADLSLKSHKQRDKKYRLYLWFVGAKLKIRELETADSLNLALTQTAAT